MNHLLHHSLRSGDGGCNDSTKKRARRLAPASRRASWSTSQAPRLGVRSHQPRSRLAVSRAALGWGLGLLRQVLPLVELAPDFELSRSDLRDASGGPHHHARAP